MSSETGTSRRSRMTAPIGLLIALAVVAALLLLVVEPLRVSSQSMVPTLAEGDHVVIDKLTGQWQPPEVDDLVVFREPQADGLAVKRVVALEGSSVALEDGVLLVDGVARVEPQVDVASVDSVYFGPVTVPAGTVFVLGDNRGASIDSRDYGAIPVGQLLGRVALSF